MLITQLQSLGLNKAEVSIYMYVLEHGAVTPPQIARGTGIARTNTYHVLRSLEALQLIQPVSLGKRQAYIPKDPAAFYEAIEKKKRVIDEILPELRGLHAAQTHKPKIQYYDGDEEIKHAYWSSLDAPEVYAIGSTHSLEQAFPKLYTEYVSELKRRNIVFHDIVTDSSRVNAAPYMAGIMKGLYEVRYLPKKHKDIPTDMLIWNDCVAHITLEKPYFATVITSRLIAETMKTVFSTVWEML